MTNRQQGFQLATTVLCPFSSRVQAVLIEKSVEFTIVMLDGNIKPLWMPELYSKKVPALKIGSHCLQESSAIIEYIEEYTPGTLFPEAPIKKARCRALLEISNSLLFTLRDIVQTDCALVLTDSNMKLQADLQHFENVVEFSPFIAGEQYTIADCYFLPLLKRLDILQKVHPKATAQFLSDSFQEWKQAVLCRESSKKAFHSDFEKQYISSIKKGMFFMSA